MEANQVELLVSLAKRIKSEQKDRDRVVATLQSAKILTKKENFTGHYSNLKKIFKGIK
ncbi:hypothetical protein HMPREF0765_1337 [Sphingobacterium spiritivorum ATCC 33300]|uniref:Uncharacterized protein n=1 Tax=Sphingobacterium spiritivorum ATCC 33300 TaxID=525372 RepID=C2FVI1_SPHSI|nr:hypothetical protein [Sphingobacterium spiritivorum]EEI93039.1 hypothetical protein HMPREF0765_1337 [Sphingobacterium spiritivorum ATCC 33300]QQS96190.1 hypothetical protein I6J03_00330 [Sphingobacterium spiritivorum]